MCDMKCSKCFLKDFCVVFAIHNTDEEKPKRQTRRRRKRNKNKEKK